MVLHIDDILDRIEWCLAKRILGGRTVNELQKHPNSKYAVLESCKVEIIKLRKQVAGLNKLLDEKESP
jgi:hypothetical protein